MQKQKKPWEDIMETVRAERMKWSKENEQALQNYSYANQNLLRELRESQAKCYETICMKQRELYKEVHDANRREFVNSVLSVLFAIPITGWLLFAYIARSERKARSVKLDA
jgi:hypothetical protein